MTPGSPPQANATNDRNPGPVRQPFVRLGFQVVPKTGEYPGDRTEIRPNDPLLSEVDAAGPITWINQADAVQQFSFEYGIGTNGFAASFTVYDRTGEDLLAAVLSASTGAESVFTVFEFGWVFADGTVVRSPRYTATVSSLTPPSLNFDAAGGCSISFTVTAIGADVTSLYHMKTPKSWPDGTAPAKIVRDLFEALQTELRDSSTALEYSVEVPVDLNPLSNNGQPLIFPGNGVMPVQAFLARHVPRFTAKDPEYADDQVTLTLMPSKAMNRVSYVLAPTRRTRENKDTKAVRHYTVGHDPVGVVRRFAPTAGWAAARLMGYEGSVAGAAGRDVVTSTAGDPKWSHRATSARTIETIVQEKRAAWAEAKLIGLRASIDLLGDPLIYFGDHVNVSVYVGGGTSAITSSNPVPKVFGPLSGLYCVTAVRHSIIGGDFQTSCEMYRDNEGVGGQAKEGLAEPLPMFQMNIGYPEPEFSDQGGPPTPPPGNYFSEEPRSFDFR